jgi:hypothetical protein
LKFLSVIICPVSDSIFCQYLIYLVHYNYYLSVFELVSYFKIFVNKILSSLMVS